MIVPYARQSISDDDISAVVAVLRSDYLTQGPVVEQFENDVADYCGAAFGVAMNSATSALHVACLALDLGPGDILWTSAITFVASANCALYCGASVDFVDIDIDNHNISVPALEEKFRAAERRNCLPSVLVVVHFSGEPADLKPIKAMADKYGCRLIEDASHAIGAQYHGTAIGACQHSDITVFSFHPVKILTTGEGGMAMTNDPKLADRLRLLRSHGITRDPAEMVHPFEGSWYYEQVELGYNYRLTDIGAALGCSQLRRIETFIARRHDLARRYDQALEGLLVTRPCRSAASRSALHLYVIRIDPDQHDRKVIFDRLRASGIMVNVHYIPVYRQPFYASLGHPFESCPSAETYYQSAITLPMYADLTHFEQDTVVDALRKALG